MPALPLTAVRAAAALALAPRDDTDPPVLDAPVDAVTPPALVLGWDDPWVALATTGRGYYLATLTVWAFAGRPDPGAGTAELEQLVIYTVERLDAAADTTWPLTLAQAPRTFASSGVELLGARLSFQVPVSLTT